MQAIVAAVRAIVGAGGSPAADSGLSRLEIAARLAFLAFAVLVVVRADAILLLEYPLHVDVEIPLRGAERWLAGQPPYNPEAFLPGTETYDLPFLYPPYLLPFLAPLTLLPRIAVQLPWMALNVGLAYWSGRRLGLPRLASIVLLAWPPFLEAILGGNVQIVIFAAFVGLLWHGGRLLEPGQERRPVALEGVLAAIPAALKLSLVHPLAYLLRRSWRAAIVGGLVLVGLAVVTLPLVGLDPWRGWLEQLSLASAPRSSAAGMAASAIVGRPLGIALTATSLILALFIRGPGSGRWLGILMVVGATSIHIYGFLFLLPALRHLRREISFVAAGTIALYHGHLAWGAVILVIACLALARFVPRLTEDGARAPRSAPG